MHVIRNRFHIAGLALLAAGLSLHTASAQDSKAAEESPAPSRQMGLKYSPLAQINAANVKDLQPAWEYHTGELNKEPLVIDAFEDEPTLIEGNLVVCTPSRHLIALDPATGKERWVFDPQDKAGGMKKCRGVSTWTDPAAPADAACKSRILYGTEDYRLIALDAKSGARCADFGTNGEVQMKASKPQVMSGEVSASSRPAVVNGVVVVGSAVLDSVREDSPSGRVLAFDARTGKQVWEFDPIPRNPADPAMATWLKGSAGDIGSGNVWAEMAVDEALDLVYLPTTSPSGDFYGGDRPGENHYADSVVALKGATGEVAWSFQLTHHNIWDYDTPSQALLIDLPHNGETVPALVQTTKTGMIFVLNRKTGEPIFPVEERPVPQKALPGEWVSPTQPYSTLPSLARLSITPDDAWGFTPIDRWLCKRIIEKFDFGSVYTPPSLKGILEHPAGGANWGGGAYDPGSHVVVIPTNRVPAVLMMIPRDAANVPPMPAHMTVRDKMVFKPAKQPYVTTLRPLLSPLGAPCVAPPWAALTAVDLVSGTVKWEVPLGSIEKLAPVPLPWEMGAPGAGGPLITAGGLVFIGYATDDKLRAVDVQTGKTVWKTELPAAGTATPVTYEIGGEQYVVIAAGGHAMYGSTKGDSLVAYRLKH